MNRLPPFDAQHLTSISQILAETTSGLSGSEIAYLLGDCKIPDTDPAMTKWKRLFNALVGFQNSNQFGNHVVMFINKAMNPVRYTSCPDLFESRRSDLNVVLAFSGYVIGEDGKIRSTPPATNLNDALGRANKLHATLASRSVHPDVLAFCRAELLQENYFHAVLEAMKSIAAKIRNLSGLSSDGADLVNAALALGQTGVPVLAINSLSTETDKGEQRGFVNLLIGLFGTIRNPAAHNPRLEWPMNEQDAVDILTMASLIHRKLDRAKRLK